MTSRSWIPKRDGDRAQTCPESSCPLSLLRRFLPNRGFRSLSARQAGGTSSGVPAPVASNKSHVEAPDSVESPEVVVAASTQEQNVTTSSRGAMQDAYDFANILLPLGFAAAKTFPPAKAAIGGIVEIVKLVDVSFHYRHDPHSHLSIYSPFE